ncbi:mitochondrial fission ELM1 family protein [Algihabitans albus]|uniref:mitochondrial fission ELM1 family protein n=1 Tax=Algihabitans albus TaxID=2164067 RepID=UPI0035CFA9DB
MTLNTASGAVSCWVLSDGRAGIEAQALGLAEALGTDPAVKRLTARRPWVWLPPRMWLRPLVCVEVREGGPVAPPWPDIVISSGRRAAAVSAAVGAAARRAGARTFAIHIQRPYLPLDRFDLVVAPRHDRLTGANVLATLGALGRVTPARLATAAEDLAPETLAAIAALPRPRIAVAVGGSSRVFRFGRDEAQALAQRLRQAQVGTGGSLLVTVSRRTGRPVAELLRRALADLPGRFYDGCGAENPAENPYLAFLGLADAIVVTGDSVNMASEAAATGKPVHIFGLPGGSAKFDRFHRDLREAGIARPFMGDIERWSYVPLAEASRIAREIQARMSGVS